MRIIVLCIMLLGGSLCAAGQQQAAAPIEQRVALNETAGALDGSGAPALEATLRTTALHGAEDSPVTNIRLVVKNASNTSYAFITGLVTFYDGSGVRCGEGIFKADALAVNEAFETDTPGIRIRCAPSTWRIVATNLLPRVPPTPITPIAETRGAQNLIISIDGEEHPIQLDKPMVLTVGNAQRTIVLREAP